MSKFRDLAVSTLGQADKEKYRDRANHLVSQAQVYAILDLADAIRNQEKTND